MKKMSPNSSVTALVSSGCEGGNRASQFVNAIRARLIEMGVPKASSTSIIVRALEVYAEKIDAKIPPIQSLP